MHQLPSGAQETIRKLENQIDEDDGATTVYTGNFFRIFKWSIIVFMRKFLIFPAKIYIFKFISSEI